MPFRGVGAFVGTGGLIGSMQEQGNTEFNVGLSLDSFVGSDGKWQLDTMTLSTGFLTHTLSDVLTNRPWSATPTEPFLFFNGTDTAQEKLETAQIDTSTRTTTGTGGTTGSSTHREITNEIHDSKHTGSGDYFQVELGVDVSGTGSVTNHYNSTTNLDSSRTRDLSGALIDETGFGIKIEKVENISSVLGSGLLSVSTEVTNQLYDALDQNIGSETRKLTDEVSITEGKYTTSVDTKTTTYAMRAGELVPVTLAYDAFDSNGTLSDVSIKSIKARKGSTQSGTFSDRWKFKTLSENRGYDSFDTTSSSNIVVDLLTEAQTSNTSSHSTTDVSTSSNRYNVDNLYKWRNTTTEESDGDIYGNGWFDLIPVVERGEDGYIGRGFSQDSRNVTHVTNALGNFYLGSDATGTHDSTTVRTHVNTRNGVAVPDDWETVEVVPDVHDSYNVPIGVNPELNPELCTPRLDGTFDPFVDGKPGEVILPEPGTNAPPQSTGPNPDEIPGERVTGKPVTEVVGEKSESLHNRQEAPLEAAEAIESDAAKLDSSEESYNRMMERLHPQNPVLSEDVQKGMTLIREFILLPSRSKRQHVQASTTEHPR